MNFGKYQLIIKAKHGSTQAVVLKIKELNNCSLQFAKDILHRGVFAYSDDQSVLTQWKTALEKEGAICRIETTYINEKI